MKAKRVVLPLLAVVLVCLYPCAFHYLQNAGEAHAADMLPMLGLLLATAAGLLALGGLILRDLPLAGLFTGLMMLLVCNGGLLSATLKRHLSWFHDRYLLLAIVALAVLLLVFFRRHKKFPGWECCAILAVLFGAMTVIRLIPAAPTLWQVLTFRPAEGEIDPETAVFSGEKPNVYYFIVDEYGGRENLERYYPEFDNEPFLQGLEDRGFQVSGSSKNTESIWTSTLVPNLLNLDYVVEDLLPDRVKLGAMEDPALFQIFRNNGYQVNLISHKAFIGGRYCNLLHPPQHPERITSFVFDNSLYNTLPYVRGRLKDTMDLEDTQGERESTQEIFDCMMNCAYLVGNGPTLTVSYVQSPHFPFLFDSQGNPSDGRGNIKDHEYYLEQIGYVNLVLTTAVDRILERDRDAIIVIQSDHGARYPGQMLLYYGAPDYDPVLETPYMQTALNCVYWQGKPLDIEGETGINTWRKLLNTAFGTNYSSLTPPEGYTCYGRSWHDKPQ